jgi:acetyl-CoA carboxylase, biotin carboxylase subunit
VFSKILIANRGEIACRIIRTCRKLGVQTVAIYSDADRKARHVKLADEAYPVGAAPPQQSYLNLEKILEVAQSSGAEAIHPGYGFLSENPAFARRCQEVGIRFIGPRPELMEKMGDKLRARKLARKAGLPVLPGTDDAVEDTQAVDRAWELGFPLMVKSAEGGGGIGIHVIHSLEELEPIIQRTRTVAASAFGSSRLFFERYLKGASHIEVQIIGDEHGNLLHLYERDCSIQRRNQKLIEETPAVKLTPQLRRKICRLALKLAGHIGYTNAGTVEFLVSAQGQIYFLEMNTRLQVEHGVTELVTGLDLVELQLRVAAGEALPLTQKDIQTNGHAIEARVYPEDPDTFMPDIGVVSGLHLPSCRNVRVDTALGKGYEVTLHYEPLLAKVMAWGQSREVAIKRLHQALLAFRLEGVKCNIPLLRDVLTSPDFQRATHHTGSLSAVVESRGQRQQRPGVNGHMNGNGHDKANREVAAAIGAALALAMQSSQEARPAAPATTAWRMQGRREQLLSRSLGSRGWR